MSELETEISAVRAAWLVRVSAKTVYQWINSGKLAARKVQPAGQPRTWMVRLDDLANVPGAEIDSDRLQQLSAPATQQRLERWMQGIEARLVQLEQMIPAYDERHERELAEFKTEIRAMFAEAARRAPPAALPAPSQSAYRPTLPTSSAGAAMLPDGNFSGPTARGRWLELHGWPANTTKGWHECPMGPPSAVLQWAVDFRARAGHRAGTARDSINQCDIIECPCHDMPEFA